jgi:hypothetical protein
MTYLTLINLTNSDKSLFTRDSIPSSELYSNLKKQILEKINQKNISANKLLKNKEYLKDNKEEKTKIIKNAITKNIKFMQDVSSEWPAIVERHKEYLRGYQIEFDENDNIAINDIEKSKDEGFGEATKIDNFKKANPAIKLLLSTIPVVNPNDTSKLQPSSIGGAILIPTSKTYISLMNNLHNSSNIEDMLDRLRKMAEDDPNYRTLYNPKKKDKIISDFKKYIIDKETHHKSDLAIAFNIVKHVNLTANEEEQIINFMFDRLQSSLKNINLSKAESVYFFKKQLIMEYVETNVITRKTKT